MQFMQQKAYFDSRLTEAVAPYNDYVSLSILFVVVHDRIVRAQDRS